MVSSNNVAIEFSPGRREGGDGSDMLQAKVKHTRAGQAAAGSTCRGVGRIVDWLVIVGWEM
ncbi:hypothetical protein E4U60_003820 [Claviceps pazoutovae]|uniref:Uncharacterized protein n=1 Tax=Claviceps pazoutovae TaxID=1649127 RepID=A0A9P7M9V2_9HYPO|nr:hypothetical protein E4U60_003820 [Claviceps pazoutovae]